MTTTSPWGQAASPAAVMAAATTEPDLTPSRPRYDGRLGELYVIYLRHLVLMLLTLCWSRFWGRTRIRRYLWNHFAILGVVGFIRITTWATIFGAYGEHALLVALTVAGSLLGVVLWGTLAGSMLPFALKRAGVDPATSSAPFVATLVDVTGLIIYFSVAALVLKGTLL